MTWTSLKETLSGQGPYTFADIVATFEWAAGVGDYLEIKKQVYARLETLLPEATDEEVARKFDQFFAFVFERLCQPGTKRLDQGALQESLSSSDGSQEYLEATRAVADRLDALEERVAKLEIRVDRHDKQLESHQASIEKLEETQEGSLKTLYPAEEFRAVSAVWKIRRILQSTAEDLRQSVDIRERAAAMLGSVSLPELFLVFHVLCTDEWGYNTEADGFVIVSDRRREEESQAIAELTNRYPDPADQVRAIESVTRLARTSRVDPVSVDSFLSRLCSDRDFLFAFSEHLVSNDDSVLRQVAGIAIRAWRAIDQAEYLRYGLAFIDVKNDFMVHSVTVELCSGPALQNVTAKDVEIISVLAGRSEPWILRRIFQALGSLSKPGPFSEKARKLVREVNLGDDSDLADAYCQIIGPGPFRVSASSVDLETLRAMAAKLVPVYELEKHHFGEFVTYVCGMIPLEIVDLLERRLRFARTLIRDDQRPLFRPLPSPQHWSSLSTVRQSPHYEEALRWLFELGVQFPEQNVYLDDFFWRFGTLDETTFRVLDDGIHTGELDRFRRTLSLLCNAPKKIAFSHPTFTLHVLTESELRGKEWGNTAMDILVNNCIVTGGVRADRTHHRLAQASQIRLAH